MAYLPGSYESKLNTLFKPNSISDKNKPTFQPDIANYPIYIPNPPIDNNTLIEFPTFSTTTFQPTPHPTQLWTTMTTTTTTTTSPTITQIATEIETSGPSFSTHSPEEQNFEDLFNNTVYNVTKIIDDFLNANNFNGSNPNPNIHETATANNGEWIFNETLTTLGRTSTPKPTILINSSPIASKELLITYGFFIIFLSILGIISNSATINLLFKNSINLHIRKHYTNMTILNLAVANLIASVFVGFGGGINVLSIGLRSSNSNMQQKVLTNYDLTPTPITMANMNSNINIIPPAALIVLNGSAINTNLTDPKSFEDVLTHLKANVTRNIMTKVGKIDKVIREKSQVEDRSWICKTQCFFTNLGNFVSIWTLAVITADRFFAHNWPLKYNQLVDTKRFAILMAYIWIQGVLFSSLSIALWNKEKLLEKGTSTGLCHCLVNWLYIPGSSSLGTACIKILSFIWMQIFPYSIIFSLNSFIVHKILNQRTKVTDVAEEDLPDSGTEPVRSFSFDSTNPVNRFFQQSNPHQDQMIWRVMPPPLTPTSQFQSYGTPPVQQLFTPTFAGGMRRTGLQEIHELEPPGKNTMREATTESVLNCYLAVTFAYIWLHTLPGCLSFLLFVSESESFILTEMIAFLFKLIGLSINVAIYFWLRKDFHDAFSGLFTQLCSFEFIQKRKTGPGGRPGVLGDEWY